jgi:hypothetical protein
MDAGSTALILAAPWLPTVGLNLSFIDHPLTRLVLLVALVYAIRQGPVTGLLALLAVFSLLIERNHQVLTLLPDQKVVMPKKSFGLPVAAPRILADHESHYYEAHDDKGMDTEDGQMYESAQDLIDSNPKLQEVPQGEAAGPFYESKGLVTA